MVYGHRAKCTGAGQRARAWSNCFRALSKISRIAEVPVVAVVVVNVNTVLSGKLLKGLLGGQCFDGGIIDLVVYETQSGVMVHKDGATSVPLLGEFPFQLGVNPTSVDTIW